MTPLHHAAVAGVINSMEALLELGADIHATSIGSAKTAEEEARAVSRSCSFCVYVFARLIRCPSLTGWENGSRGFPEELSGPTIVTVRNQ